MKGDRTAWRTIAAILILAMLLSVLPMVAPRSALGATVYSRTYTTDADFDEGTLVGVEHETVHDQLQLSKEVVTLPFIWVPNNNGTVSKVHTETGKELGRYQVAPHSDCSPSRTTVDLQGNCWVGLRQAGTVVKIGLSEAGQCIDRNGDGTIQTSQDLNDDGDITGGEILPWSQDECVLYEVVLIPGKEGTYVPGTYTGGYDYDYWGTAPRGLAVDASNNLWAGTSGPMKYYYIDGSTGAILKTIDVSPWGHGAYGAVIDKYGVVWSSGNPGQDIYIDPSTDPPTIGAWNPGHFVYGIGLDYLDHLFASGWEGMKLSKIDVLTGATMWTQDKPELYQARGVVCTSDNDVWVASTAHDKVYRYDNDGNYKAEVYVGNGPTGVAVDAAGKVWSCNLEDEYITRIDPATNTVDFQKQIIGSWGHYTYSDMTGIIARTVTTRIGTWTVVFDSESPDMPWGTVSWNSYEPAGTSVTVRVRSSNDQTSWSAWEATTNGVPLSSTPDGRYLQIETTLQIISGDVSPILYDLTVAVGTLLLPVDIKPGSCPNPFETKSKGVLPIAILGTEGFDVSTIDPATIELTREGAEEGVAPLRWSYEDVATPFEGELCDCHELGGDGYMDLTLKFDTQEVKDTLGLEGEAGNTIPLLITGNLKEEAGGTPIEGWDCVWVLETDKK